MSEWGPWIEHDGKGCPCVGMFVEVRGQFFHWVQVRSFATGSACWTWKWVDGRRECENWRLDPIIRYRIRKPRALEQLREIARSPERELEGA